MKKKLLLTLLAAGLFLPQYVPAAGAADSGVVQKCQDNVDPAKKLLSAAVAKDCVTKLNENNGALLNGLKNDSPDEAAALVSYNNALVDLKNLTSKYSGYALAEALARELESDSCALCDMSLGPKPEKTFDWVSNNGGKADAVKKSVRTWETLGSVRTTSLGAEPEHYAKDSWNAQKIMDRYNRLSKWARKQTDILVKSSVKGGKKADVFGLLDILREDLVMPGDETYQEKLDALGAAAAKPEPKGPASIDKKAKELDAAGKNASGLSGRSTGEQQDFLNGTFDNALAGHGNPEAAGLKGGKKFTPVPITEPQAATLSSKMGTVKDGKFTGYLADEVKGTKAGDELNAFFADKKYAANGSNNLNLKFEKGEGSLSNALGWWSGSDKTTRVNTNLVDAYCASHQITPEQMLASEEHMKGVARYVAPNFVHETTHQRQDAWAGANGLDYIKYRGGTTGQPYQMEMETEAFSMQAAFSAEKAKKLGPAYLEQISSSHKGNAMKFMEDGVDALRTEKHELYPGISSMEGATAQEFKSAKAMADYLRTLEDKNKKTPAAMTDKDKANMQKYREAMDSRFKWYTMVYQKSAADEKKLLAWRDSFNDTPATPPPGLK